MTASSGQPHQPQDIPPQALQPFLQLLPCQPSASSPIQGIQVTSAF